MILSQQEAEQIYFQHPKEAVISEMRKEAEHIYMHLTGKELDKYLGRIEQYENEAQRALRKKFAKSSKARMARTLRPADKVYSAQGGSIYYDMPENNVKRFRELEKEQDLRKWMRDSWQPFAIADPNGVVFCEVADDEAVLQTTYSIAQIYEYEQDTTGAYEFIMFEPYTQKAEEKEEKYIRVVDDIADALYRIDEEKESFTFIEDESFPNYFEFVPAVQNSTKHKLHDPNFKISQIDSIIEIADEALVDSSIKSIYKKLHGFPRYWEYAQPCLRCKGTGLLEGKTCPSCKGSGYKEKNDVSDSLKLTMPSTVRIDEQTIETPRIAPDIAGYVAPDLETWRMMNEEEALLEQKMFKTMWGTQNISMSSGAETATGRFIDAQPVENRLNDFSEEAERVEGFVLHCKATFYFGQSFKGVVDRFGRRFAVEGVDALMDKYTKARSAGAPDSVLNPLLESVYYAEFQGDSLRLDRQLKLMKVEPFIHKDLSTLAAGSKEFTKKLHYNEWLSSVPDIDITTKSAADLRELFTKYLEENGLQQVSGVPGREDGFRQAEDI